MSDDREPVECCKCHQSMSLDDGCEWGDSERLYCWGCAHDEIERLRAIVDRQSKALNACKRELILYAGEHPDDWDDGTADAIAQVDAAEKARKP